VRSYKELRTDLSTWNGSDLFRGEGYGSTLFQNPPAIGFSEHWGEYVRIDPSSRRHPVIQSPSRRDHHRRNSNSTHLHSAPHAPRARHKGSPI